MSDDPTYYIRRFCFNEEDPDNRRTMAEGLTLDEAQAWCSGPDTSGTNEFGPWFDGYDQE